MRATTRDTLWLASLLAAAAALRGVQLDGGMWHDEIHTLVTYARSSPGEIFGRYDSQNQHLLYSLLASFSLRLFGDSVWALRLPAVAFGVASVGALHLFARQVTGRGEARFATALATASYHHVWFSQNARGYTGLLFFTLLSSALFLRLLRDRGEPGPHLAPLPGAAPDVRLAEARRRGRTARGRTATLYALSLALGIAVHLTAVLVAVAHFVVALARLARSDAAERRRLRRGALAGLAAGASVGALAYAPALPDLAVSFTGTARAAAAAPATWQDPTWFVRELVAGLGRGAPGGIWVAVGAGILAAVGMASFLRRDPWAAAVMLAPGALTGAALLLLERNLWPRYFFAEMGFGLLFAARGASLVAAALTERLSGASPKRVTAVLGGAAVLASLATVPSAWGPKQDYEAARRFVESAAVPGDVVGAVGMASLAFGRYLATGWPAVSTLDDLLALERRGGSGATWVLYTFPTRLCDQQPALLERLLSGYAEAASFAGTLNGGEVVVAVRRGGATK